MLTKATTDLHSMGFKDIINADSSHGEALEEPILTSGHGAGLLPEKFLRKSSQPEHISVREIFYLTTCSA